MEPGSSHPDISENLVCLSTADTSFNRLAPGISYFSGIFLNCLYVFDHFLFSNAVINGHQLSRCY